MIVLLAGSFMVEVKKSWDDIPSINNLQVDWKYEPDNPLGKRAYSRLSKEVLNSLLGTKKIPIKVVSADRDVTNLLLDISQGGMAVLSNNTFTVGEPLKVGFFLQKQKIISRAVVRNIIESGEQYRVGMEFVNLDNKAETIIKSLIASQMHQY